MPSTPEPGTDAHQRRDAGEILTDYSTQMRFKAHKLASKAIEEGVTTTSLIAAATSIEQAADIQVQRFADKIDLLHKDGQMPNIACKKGCWYCCVVQVMATVPEILRLAAWIQENFTDEEISQLKDRLSAYWAEVSDLRTSGGSRPPIKCPILVDGACSAHPGRPIACRGANSFDVEACKRALANWEEDRDVPLVAHTLHAGKAMVAGLNDAVEAVGVQTPIVEMPLALHIALNDPTAGDRFVAGEPVFAVAQVDSQGRPVAAT